MSAGVTTTARSTCSGMSPMLLYALSPRSSEWLGLTGYTFDRKGLSIRFDRTVLPTVSGRSVAPIIAMDSGTNKADKPDLASAFADFSAAVGLCIPRLPCMRLTTLPAKDTRAGVGASVANQQPVSRANGRSPGQQLMTAKCAQAVYRLDPGDLHIILRSSRILG